MNPTLKNQSKEPHDNNILNKLNILRAGVLGANDGIVSIAGLVIGVAGATTDSTTLLVAGLAGLAAGALSMGGGEYVSVSTQKDTEKATIKIEADELKNDANGELQELTDIYKEKGLSNNLARQVAIELTKKDALSAHADAELNIDPKHYSNPWSAAISSMFSFFCGALLPLFFIILLPEKIKVIGTFFSVLVALALTGFISAYLGNAPKKPAIIRNISVGIVTMAITYLIGALVEL